MAGKNTAAFGIYSTQRAVENAVDRLRAEGYRNTDISVLFPENEGTKDFAHEKHTKAPEGATTGAGTGVVIGGWAELACGNRRSCDSRLRAVHCSRSDYGSFGWSRSRRDCRRSRWSLGRIGHSGI